MRLGDRGTGGSEVSWNAGQWLTKGMAAPAGLLCAAAVSVPALCAPAPAAADTVALSGTWRQLVNCLPTNYNPLTDQIHCIGASAWKGTWTGTTTYTLDGTYDVLTGDTKGTVHEVFTGTASDGTSGTLTFTEQVTITGATGKFVDESTILSGTGGFAGSTGSAEFVGTSTALTGSGTYSGTWTRPSPQVPPVTPPKRHRRHRHRHRG